MLERLKRLWKLSEPQYIVFLDRQTRSTIIKDEEGKPLPEEKLRKSATIVQDDPLDIFDEETETIE